MAIGATRLKVAQLVGAAEQNGADVVDVVGAGAASLAGPPVAQQDLRPDVPTRPG
jgi:hypothetical protein